MSTPGTPVNCDAALRQIDRIPDPVTPTLVNMAFVHVVTEMHLRGTDSGRRLR